MDWGHDSGLSAGGLCGCGNCASGQAATLDGRQSLSTSESSGDSTIDALVAGTSYKWGPTGLMGQSVTVTYSFMTSAPSYNSGTTTFQEFNDTMKAAARLALAEWTEVANITFVEVADTGNGGSIRFGTESMSEASGYAYYPATGESGGDVWIANNYAYNTSPVVGEYGYLTLMHEIGHAIGLKHPGNYNAGGGGTEGPYLSSATDNTDNTVMSYTDGSVLYPTSVGPYDILSARYLYGYSGTGTIGNVTFGADTAETVTGDSGVQYVHARDGADYIALLGGNDGVAAGSGIDTVLGGDGGDLVYGNLGADLLSGGSGSDTIFGGQNDGPASAGSDDSYAAFRSGIETIAGGDGGDMLYGNLGGDLMLGGSGIDQLFGGQDADTLSGGAGDDSLNGNKGTDVLVGGDGLDRFIFGAGSGADTVSDFTYFTDYLVIQSNVNGSGITSFSTLVARATQVGSDVVIDLGSGNSVTLTNYSTASLISDDVLII